MHVNPSTSTGQERGPKKESERGDVRVTMQMSPGSQSARTPRSVCLTVSVNRTLEFTDVPQSISNPTRQLSDSASWVCSVP